MSLPEPFDNKNNCFATKNATIAGILTDPQIADLNKIDSDNTTFLKSNIAITDGLNTTIPNLFETIILAYEQLADVFSQIGIVNENFPAINSEISSIKSQIQTINSEINKIKEEIEALKPKPE